MRGVDIALPLSLAIEGRVLDEAGEPLSRMPVFAARLTPGSDTAVRMTSVSSLTDDLGRYRIYGLEAGTYLVATEGRGGVTFVEPFEGRPLPRSRSSSSWSRSSRPFIRRH